MVNYKRADSVPRRTNTFASRDQFKPIKIKENLVVDYKRVGSISPGMGTIASRVQFKPIRIREHLVVG